MPDYFKLHEAKKEEFSELNSRRDTDRELITSFEYVMKGLDDKKIGDIINVTMNRLRVFKAYVEASLNKADEKVVVESDDESIDTAEIEDAIRRAFASADSRLIKRGDFPLDPFIDQQSCMRGEAVTRVLFQMLPPLEGEENREEYLDTDITAWDARFVTYERGFTGLAWGALETKKTKGQIESELWAIEKKFTISGKDAPVVDIWTPEGNLIYVAGKLEWEQEHLFGVTPICVQRVPIGTMLSDEDNLQYQGESIFFLVRDIINEYNRCLSILQSLNLRAVKPHYKQKRKGGGEASDPEDLSAMGGVTAMDIEEDIQLLDYGDIKQAMIVALQEINKALDDGTLSRITLGDLPGELSAIALLQVEQGQGQVFMPRLGTRGLLKQQTAEMFIRQIIGMGVSNIEIGVPGHKKTFKISDLEGEYSIEFRYSNKSPETDFARLSMARQYKDADMLDELTIMTDIMKRDDPEGDLGKLYRQRLRMISPNLRMYDGLMALAKDLEDGDESAKAEIAIIEAELGVSIDSIMAGNLPQPEQGKATKPVEIPELTETGRGSAQRAADLTRSPGEGV